MEAGLPSMPTLLGRGDGPGSRNDASSHFLTVGTRCGNSVDCRQEPCTELVLAHGFRRHSHDTPPPPNDPGGTGVPLQPTEGHSVVSGYVQPMEIPMSNPNQNPGQQNQTPGQKPGQQQGGGQKPGQQQQDPNRQGQNPGQQGKGGR